jgi:hypothetical protein
MTKCQIPNTKREGKSYTEGTEGEAQRTQRRWGYGWDFRGNVDCGNLRKLWKLRGFFEEKEVSQKETKGTELVVRGKWKVVSGGSDALD